MSNYQANTLQANEPHILLAASPDSIEFNGYSLMSLCGASTGVIVQKANFFDLTNIDVAEYVADQIDGGGIIQKKYGNKNITLTLMIQATSYDTLTTAIDSLKSNLQDVEGDLDILINGLTRTYTATVTSIRVPPFKKSADWVDGIEVGFVITSPHWYKKGPTSRFFSSVTTDIEPVINNVGTYESFPKILIACKTSGNSGTSIAVELKKIGEVSGYTVTLTETITNNDVIIFDYKNKIVSINDVEQNFSGVMAAMTR
jgi:hypothetical protein